MSTAQLRIIALVAAAGQSRRMGRAKQLLAFRRGTVLEAVLDALDKSLVATACVVTSTQMARALNLARRADTLVAINDCADSHMLDSFKIGLRHIVESGAADVTGILACPGDQPSLETATIDLCIQGFGENTQKLIVAAHGGKRGHPMIFPTSMVPIVLDLPDAGGLNQLLVRERDRVRLVECSSPAVLQDIDTFEDYQALTRGMTEPEGGVK